jgi:hypothetical protein
MGFAVGSSVTQRRIAVLQEYGDDSPAPNRNTVYLAYLDSVKHFRPEEKDSGGNALRTMVYHEVLLAYIDRAKMLGMNSIYIWSCPPLAVCTCFMQSPGLLAFLAAVLFFPSICVIRSLSGCS